MENQWKKIDFNLNASYWNHWGNDAALPFRLRNLVDAVGALSEVGIVSSLHGTTLRHAVAFDELQPDHDDDLAFESDYETFLNLAVPVLIGKGFSLIRDSSLVSLVRWGRYLDFHPADVGAVSMKRVHGELLPISENSDLWIAKPRTRKTTSPKKWVLDTSMRMVRALRNPTLTIGTRFETLGKKITGWSKRQTFVSLTEADFLNLELDSVAGMNWEWRGMHLLKVATPGMKLGEILQAARDPRFFHGIEETPTNQTFDEPIALSRQFWHSGNNFFVAPLLFGFRHLVVPYDAANLYIRHIQDPPLYSSAYFESLSPMSQIEIEKFLSSRPLEVTGNSESPWVSFLLLSVCSGR